MIIGLGVVFETAGRCCCGCGGAANAAVEGRGCFFFAVVRSKDDGFFAIVVAGVTTADNFLAATAVVVVETGVFMPVAAAAGCFLTAVAEEVEDAGVDGRDFGLGAAAAFFLAYGLYRGMMDEWTDPTASVDGRK